MSEIKSYDEVLDTLKNVRNYLKIARADDCVDELDKVAKYLINKNNNNPTLDECIKEWEERGWELRNIDVGLQFYKLYFLDTATINFYVKDYNGRPAYRVSYSYIDYEISCLITKTLKALEVNKNE